MTSSPGSPSLSPIAPAEVPPGKSRTTGPHRQHALVASLSVGAGQPPEPDQPAGDSPDPAHASLISTMTSHGQRRGRVLRCVIPTAGARCAATTSQPGLRPSLQGVT